MREDKPASPRKFIGVHFKCCNIYQRIYKNKDGTAYEGTCPKCYKKAVIHIGSEGSDSRFFEAM